MRNHFGQFGRVFCCIAIVSSGSALAGDGERTVLTIGQLYGHTSLPLEQINADSSLPFELSARLSPRPESFPWFQPLPDVPNYLPDVINAMVGYRHNELVGLVRKGLIEPLDDFFEEAGVDPEEFLLPNAYDAVCFDGHVWALPHRMQFFLLSFDESLFNELGLSPTIDSWQAFREAAEAVARADGGSQQGFTIGQVPVLGITAFLLHFFEREGIRADEIAGFQEFMMQLGSGGALDGPAWATMNAVSLETFHTPKTGRRVVPLPPSNALTEPVGTEEAARLGFMEVFALRINSDEKRDGGKLFLRWLMRTETQLQLMRASSFDVPKRRRLSGNCHLTLYRPVLNSDVFGKWCEEHPAYTELAGAASEVNLTTASQSLEPEVFRGKYRKFYNVFWQFNEPKDLIGAMGGLMDMLNTRGLKPEPGRDLPGVVSEPSAAEEGDYQQAAAAWLNAWIQSPEIGEDVYTRLYGAWLKDGEWMAPLLFGGDSLNDAALNPLKERVLRRTHGSSEPNGMDERLQAIGKALAKRDLEHLCDILEPMVAQEMPEHVSRQDKTEFTLSVFLLGGSRDCAFLWPERAPFALENRFYAIRHGALESTMNWFDALSLDVQAFYTLRIAERFMDDIQVKSALDILEHGWRNPNISKRWRERLLTRYATLLADECTRPKEAADAYAGYCRSYEDAPGAFRVRADSLNLRALMSARGPA